MGNKSSTSVINGNIKGAVPEAVSSTESVHFPSIARERRLGACVPPSIKGVTNGVSRELSYFVLKNIKCIHKLHSSLPLRAETNA